MAKKRYRVTSELPVAGTQPGEEFEHEWPKRDIPATWEQYGGLVRDLALSGLADVLAHPDVVKVYGHRPADETPLHDLILNGASVNGTAIEMNSNGFRRAGEMYPAPPLLLRAQALGLPITFASDAHTPDRVGADFARLATHARDAGYTEASVFESRTRRAYAIPT